MSFNQSYASYLLCILESNLIQPLENHDYRDYAISKYPLPPVLILLIYPNANH